MVDEFLNNDRCRVFLFTDAGGVGLNLQQAAATVINMDQPWNPAVLEQRIARVQRLGQKRSVQVVHLSPKERLKKACLVSWPAKKSLFAGILDGAEEKILLNGTRLSRFMENVENVTRNLPASSHAREEQEQTPVEEPASASTLAGNEALTELITARLKFLNSLAVPVGTSQATRSPQSGCIETDPETGRSYLKLPAPEPETLRLATSVLSKLLEKLG